MTFRDLTNKFYKHEDILNNKLIDSLIFYLSKLSQDKASLLINKDIEIDFELKDFLYFYKKVFIDLVPIEYITKKIKFLGITYNMEYKVFIPRSDTEFIVDWILESEFINRASNVLDLCTGSGVIANTIKYYKQDLNVYGIDNSFSAIELANDNAKLHGLNTKFFWKNIFSLKQDFLYNFNLIICNPPYIDKKYPLDKSVKKYEPKKALFAKDNGLEYYKRFVFEIFPKLNKNTKIIFEIGYDQKEKLEQFLTENSITNFFFLKDLNNNYRILVIDK